VSAVLVAHLLAAATIATPNIDYTAILPELLLIGGAIVILGLSAMFAERLNAAVYAALTGAFAVAALIDSLVLWDKVSRHGPFTTIAQSVSVDGFSVLFLVLVCVVLVLSALFGEGYLRREGLDGAEYFALAMLSGSGAMLMGAAGDLIVIFLGLEILSIALYVLAGIDLRRLQSGEAAMKYFVLGAFSSAIFVYGIALAYGATGSTNIAQIAGYLAHNPAPGNGLLLAGVGLLLVGFGFKVAAVPFHMWTPDVYQGSPAPVVGFMASVAKAGGFAAMLRVLFDAFPSLSNSWQPMIWVLAVLSLLGGAVLALVQRDIKRMLAYSSINHAGFVLLGVQAATAKGLQGSLFYLFTYAVMVVGTFGLVSYVGAPAEGGNTLDHYRGLARRRPLVAMALTLLLVAQAGVPATTGLLMKFYVLAAAVEAHSYVLAVVAMVSAAIAAVFYLRVVFYMYSPGLPATGSAGLAAGALAVEREPAVAMAGAGAGAVPAGTAASGYVPGDAAPQVGFGPDAHAASTAGSAPAPAAPPEGAGVMRMPPAAVLATVLSIGFTVVFGIWPQPLSDFVNAAHLLF
jgi:NADH-quinone oxidoreductase subunit N